MPSRCAAQTRRFLFRERRAPGARELSSISKICEDMDVHISGLNAKAEKDETVKINLTLSIQNKNQMEKICRSLKGIPGIMEAYRTTT